MNRKKMILLFITVIVLTIGIQASYKLDRIDAFSPQIIQHGAVGDDVIELQSRLEHLGFYSGKVDGVFGWGTYWALRNFQYEFGMEIDGLAGAQAKERLVKASNYDEKQAKEQINKGKKPANSGGGEESKQPAPSKDKKEEAGAATDTSAVNVPQGYSQNDIQLIANAVYGEARGEPYVGQVAVAAVILNRVNSATFPNNVAGVIFEPRAFTAVADGQIWLTPNDTAKEAVLDAINGWDPSGNAEYYFNPDTATSAWIWTRPQIKKIGKHIFCN